MKLSKKELEVYNWLRKDHRSLASYSFYEIAAALGMKEKTDEEIGMSLIAKRAVELCAGKYLKAKELTW